MGFLWHFGAKKGCQRGQLLIFLLFFCRKLACQGVCYGKDTRYDSHNDTADVGVLCLLVDYVADVCRYTIAQPRGIINSFERKKKNKKKGERKSLKKTSRRSGRGKFSFRC